MDSMYEIIMDLPLFQGVSREKISEVIEKTRFHFLKYPDGEQVVCAGDWCKHVRFIISGAVKSEMTNFTRRVSISEILNAPNVIGPDYLFGRDTTYPFTVTAHGGCGILQVEKADYLNILQSDQVFLFNLLNTLSRNTQRSVQGVLALSTSSVAERLAFIVTSLTQRGGTDITVRYKQKDLCALMGVQRSSLICGLEKMREDGIIDFDTTAIHVKDRDALLKILYATTL